MIRGVTREAYAVSCPALRNEEAQVGAMVTGIRRGDDVERADHERNEVARERLGLFEGDGLRACAVVLLGGHGGVRRRDIVLRHVEDELPGHLVARLVEARERAPRVGRLEEGVEVRAPIRLALHVDAAAALGVDAPSVAHREVRLPRRHVFIEHEADEVFASGNDVGRERGRRTDPRQLRVVHREADRVQPEDARRRQHVEVESRTPAEVLRSRVQPQLEVDARRPRHRRQAKGRGLPGRARRVSDARRGRRCARDGRR